MKAIFNQHIGIFENAFPNEWCDLVIQKFKQYQSFGIKRSDYWNEETIDQFQAIDTSLSFSLLKEQFKDPDFDKYGNLPKDIIPKCFQLYKRKYQLPHSGFTFFDTKIQRTLPKEGYHTWHIEDASIINDNIEDETIYDMVTRFGVWTIYLNNIEEGGETEFLMQSIRIKPKKGTLCFFPSSYTHLHRGNPPLKEEKFICTGWLHISDMRKNRNIIIDKK